MELNKRIINFTFCEGLVQYIDGDVTEAINKADEKLYQAKKQQKSNSILRVNAVRV